MTKLMRALSLILCIITVISAIPFTATMAKAADVTIDDIVKAAGDLIRPNEGTYASVNPNDNGAVSVGWIQWHANRALNLLRSIVEKDTAKAKALLGEALYNEITNPATVWTTRTMTQDEASKLSALLDTQNGRDAQDALAAGDIGSYINHAAGLGVKDPSALVYHADIENQCGWGGAKRVLDAASTLAGGYDKITLDILYEAALADTVAGKYAVRRQKTYNNCLLLEWAEMKTDLEVWDILSVRNVREKPDTQSMLLTSIPAGMKVIILEKVYYAAENSTRARTTMGWITLTASSASLNRELSGGTVPAPINFDTNGGVISPLLANIKATGRNVLRSADDLIVYDSEYSGKNAPTNAYGTETVIDSTGAVITAPAYGVCKSDIPEGGFVLSGHGTMGAWISQNIKAGYFVAYNKSSLEISVYKDRNAYLAAVAATSIDAPFGELPTPKRSGYIFCGWQDASGNAVSFDTVCTEALCVTLKAVWEESEGTRIVYKKDGGTFKNTADAKVDSVNASRGANSLVVYYNSATTGTNEHGTEVCVDANGRITEIFGYGNGNAPIPEGGFVISSHGSASAWLASFIKVGSVVEFDEDDMSITAYKDDETYDSINKTITADFPIGTLPEIEKQYHRFLGWYTTAGEKATEITIMPEGGIVLLAKWEVLPGSIVYNTDGGTISALKAEATLTGTNTLRGSDALILFKDRATTQTNKYGTEVLVGKDGIVDFVHPVGVGSTVIPTGSFVLSGHGTMSDWLSSNVSKGNYVTVNNKKISVWESKEAFEAEKNTSVLYGNKVGPLHTPTKDGYVFLGWQDSLGNTVEADSTVSSFGDLTLTAVWKKLLTVTFDPAGGILTTTKKELVAGGVNIMRSADSLVIYTGKASTQTNNYGAEVIVSKDGIVTAINGYGKGNSRIPDGGMVISAHGAAKDRMLEAVKLGSYVSVAGYKLEIYESPRAFDCEDGKLCLESGSALGALANAVMPQKALSGWERNGVRYTKDTLITEDLTLSAIWTALSAKVTFNPNGGSFGTIVSAQRVNGVNMLRPADSIIIYDSSYAGGIALTNRYGTEVAVDASGAVLNSPVYGACRTEIPEGGMVISGIGTGYSWIVMNLKAGRYVFFDKSTLTLKVYENYSDYLASEGKIIYTNKPYGPLPTPTRDGYVFCGWQDSLGNTVTEGFVVISCDTPVLTAIWARQFSVTLDYNGGTTASATVTATGINSIRGADDLIIYRDKASTNTNRYGTEAAIDKNGKVIAIYPYGNQNAPIPAGGIVLSGHGTMGTWIQNNLKVGSYVKVNGVNVTVYPDEISMKTPDGGSIKVGEGGKITSLPKVKKTGYVFCGWYTGGTLFNPSAPVTSDIVLLAHWEERRISVKYDLDGGSFSGTATSTAAGRNIIRPAESIVIYDGDHKSSTTGTNIYGAEVVVSAEGIVTEIRTYGLNNSPIPEGGFVLSGHNTAGSWLTKNIRIGSLIVLSENSFTVYESYEQYDIICEKTVLYGSALGTLPSAIKAGASFGGWLLPDGTKADANILISYDSSEIVLKAKWN